MESKEGGGEEKYHSKHTFRIEAFTYIRPIQKLAKIESSINSFKQLLSVDLNMFEQG